MSYQEQSSKHSNKRVKIIAPFLLLRSKQLQSQKTDTASHKSLTKSRLEPENTD